MVGGDDPFYLKFWAKLTRLQKCRLTIDIRLCASAVTRSGKSSIMTYEKSTTRFPMNLRRTAYVSPKSLPEDGEISLQSDRAFLLPPTRTHARTL